MRSLAGIGLGTLVLVSMGLGLIMVRRDGGFAPASGMATTPDAESSDAPAAQSKDEPAVGLTAVGESLAQAGIDVVDLQAGQTTDTVTYATAAATDDAARVEIRTIVRSYVSASDGREAKRVEATILENDATLGTWHIRSEWLDQLADGTLSMDELDAKVFETVSHTDSPA